MGFEPTTFCMASRRSSQLSYIRGRRPIIARPHKRSGSPKRAADDAVRRGATPPGAIRHPADRSHGTDARGPDGRPDTAGRHSATSHPSKRARRAPESNRIRWRTGHARYQLDAAPCGATLRTIDGSHARPTAQVAVRDMVESGYDASSASLTRRSASSFCSRGTAL